MKNQDERDLGDSTNSLTLTCSSCKREKRGKSEMGWNELKGKESTTGSDDLPWGAPQTLSLQVLGKSGKLTTGQAERWYSQIPTQLNYQEPLAMGKTHVCCQLSNSSTFSLSSQCWLGDPEVTTTFGPCIWGYHGPHMLLETPGKPNHLGPFFIPKVRWHRFETAVVNLVLLAENVSYQ